MKRVRSALELCGLGLITYGAFLWSVIAGFIVAGVCLALVANYAGEH